MSLSFLLFTFVLFIAVFLRFYKLTQRGLLFWDDGLRMREVQFLDDLITFVQKNFKGLLKKEVDFKLAASKFRGRFLYENPLNIFLYYLTSKIIKNVELSGLVTNGIFGTLGIVGVYFTGWIMFNQQIGFFAALILSVSGYHLMYSRSIHAEVTSGAFYIWGTFFYWLSYINLNNSESFLYLLISGLLLGCAFCSNLRQFHIPILFFIYEIIGNFSFQYWPLIPRLLILGTGMFLPIFFIEEIFIVLKEMGYPYWTFFRQLFDRSGHLTALSLRFPSLILYLKTFFYLEWLITPVVAVIGIVFLSKTISFKSFILITQFLFPIILWSSRPTKKMSVKRWAIGSYQFAVPRLISSYSYAMAILASAGLTFLPKELFYFAFAGIIVKGIHNFLVFAKIKSGYKDAIEYILEHSDGKHFSFSWEISAFYVGNDKVINVYDLNRRDNKTFEELYTNHGFRFVLYMESIYNNSFNGREIKPLTQIINSLKPVYSVELGLGRFKPFLWDEHNNPRVKIFSPNLIEVYDLSEYQK